MLDRLKNNFNLVFNLIKAPQKKDGKQINPKLLETKLYEITAKETSSTHSSNLNSKKTKVIKESEPSINQKIPTNAFPTTLEEKKALSQQFKIGDIIVTHLKSNRLDIDPIIVMLQRIAKFFGFANPTAVPTAIHIAIVVGIDKEKGQVLISESMPAKEGTRTVDLLTHNFCNLNKNNQYYYQILHPKNNYITTAEKASEIALNVAPKASYLQEDQILENSNEKKMWNKFSLFTALKSMFKRYNKFDLEAKKRLFKGIWDAHIRSTTLTGGKKPRKVFCSSFISQLFQRATAEQIWNKLIERHPNLKNELDKLIKEVKKESPNEKKDISKWARSMAEKYGVDLDELMPAFKIDFKSTSPQNFLDYILQSKIFKSAFKIIPSNL